jgi:hypothetical protein
MPHLLIPKANEERNNYPCWRGTVDNGGKELKPIVYCQCGQPCGLGNHSINEQGEISPSFFHAKGDGNGCGFHEYIKLEGYTGKAFSKNEGNL